MIFQRISETKLMKTLLGSKKNAWDELTSIFIVKEQTQLHLDNNIGNHMADEINTT